MSTKAPLDLIPLKALFGTARVLASGSAKSGRTYGDWIKLPLDETFVGKLLRHLADTQTLGGVCTVESLATADADSGMPAIDHLLANLIIVRAMMIRDGLLPADPGSNQ